MHIKILVILAFCWVSLPAFSNTGDNQPIVIMIGIDGLGADTLKRINAPNLRNLSATGVFAEMRPAMPTKTFVNFYSLATGLHPKHHGMISNKPYDRLIKRKFNIKTDQADPFWWQGEPIWITAEKQGLTAATYFWPGSEVAHDGVRPTFWKPYQQDKDYGERVDEVLQWLQLPADKRPQLVTLYFSAVDSAAHDFGVGSSQEKAAVMDVDGHLGGLIQGLVKLGLQNQVNIVIVSDHGMINLSDQKVINLDPHIDLSAFEIPDWSENKALVYSAFLNLYADQQQVKAAYSQLRNLHPNMQVYRRGDIPKSYHFDHPQRGPDLFLLADPGWSIYASRSGSMPLPMDRSGRSVATHGYDNLHPLMQATFIAVGPAFNKALVAEPLDNVEVYGLLACILGMTPANTDGEIAHVNHLLTQPCVE